MNRGVEVPLLMLQGFCVAHLMLHDWVPLGRLSNLAAVRAVDSPAKRVIVTQLSGLPFLLVFFFCCEYASALRWPGWVVTWLWWAYGILFAGELTAWWVPYFGRVQPGRAARYQVMFRGTHAFLPERNGITPNTLHVVLHLATLGILVLLPFLRA